MTLSNSYKQADLRDRTRKFLLFLFAVSLPLAIALQQIALGLLLGFFAYTCWREKKFPRSCLDLPLLSLAGALILSSVLSPAAWDSLGSFRRLWLVTAFFATYHLVREPDEIETMLWLIVGSASIVAGYGIVQHFTGLDLARQLVGKETNLHRVWLDGAAGFRTKGLHPSGITYAHNLLFPLSIGAALLCSPTIGRWRVITVLAAVGLMLGALAYSLTRGAWLAAALVFLLVVILQRSRRVLWMGAALLVPVVLLVANSGAVRQRTATIFNLDANVGRSQIWRANIDMIGERPLLGWGYGNYKKFRDSYYARYPDADTTAHAHNNLLQIWVQTGVLGLVAFAYVFWSICRNGWQAYRLLPAAREPLRSGALGCTLAVIGFLLAGLTQYNFGDAEVVIMLWFTAALGARAKDFAPGSGLAVQQTLDDHTSSRRISTRSHGEFP